MKRILFFVILATVALWGCNVEPVAELENEDQIEIRHDIMSRASAPGEGITTVSPGLVDGYLFTEIDYLFMISPDIVYNYLMGETVQSYYMSIRKYLGNGAYGHIEASSNSMGLSYDFTPFAIYPQGQPVRRYGGPGLYVVEIQIVTRSGMELIFYDLYDVIDPRPVFGMQMTKNLYTQIPYDFSATSSYPNAQISWEIRRGNDLIFGPRTVFGSSSTPYYGPSINNFIFWSPATYTVTASVDIGQWTFTTNANYSVIANKITVIGPGIETENPIISDIIRMFALSENVEYEYTISSALPGLLEWEVVKDSTGEIIPITVGRNDTMKVTFPSGGAHTITARIGNISTSVTVSVIGRVRPPFSHF